MVRIPLVPFGNFGNFLYITPLCQCLSEETLKGVGPFCLVAEWVRAQVSKCRGPGLESHRRRFESWATLFTPPCLSLSGTLLVYPKRMAVGIKGLCKEKKIPKIRVYYGSGWVGPGLTRNFLFVEKSSQNSSKPVQIFWSSIPCIHC